MAIIQVPTIDELLEEVANDLVDVASALELPLEPDDMNQGSGLYLQARAFMMALGRYWDELADFERDSNPGSARGEALDLITNAFGFFRSYGAEAVGNLVVTPRTSGVSGTAFAGLALAYGDLQFQVLTTTELPEDAPAVLVPVQATSIGKDGNLAAGLELVCSDPTLAADFLWRVGDLGLVSGVPKGNLRGGANPDLDDDHRARFADFLASLTRGTVRAVSQALQGIVGLVSIVLVNLFPMPGFFTVYVDDGSEGADPEVPNLTDENRAAVEVVLDDWSAAGVVGLIKPIQKQLVNVTMALIVDPDYGPQTVATAVRTVITAYLATLPQGVALPASKLYQLAGAVNGVLEVNLSLPVGRVAPASSVIALRPGTITVTATASAS